jgi:hypothetical protein
MKNRCSAELVRELKPWTIAALITVLTTGTLLCMSEATKCWGNPAFRNKMLFLILALVFQFTGLRIIGQAEEGRFSPFVRKATGLVAVILWFSVAAAGRAIAFY